MMLSTFLNSTALFAALALSAPASDLAKRAEGIHLTNCTPHGSSDSKPLSAVIYCANDSNCRPGASDFCTLSEGPGPFLHWEGHPFRCTFDSGVTFSFNLPENAQSKPTYSVVDTSASNGFRGFTGRKDDQTKNINYGGYSCTNIYYYL